MNEPMKNFFRNIAFLLPVCLLLTTNLFSQTNTKENPNGYNIFYHPNGKVSSEGMMRDGKPDGYWKSYHPTGIKQSEGNRINFLMDSTWVWYTQTGDTSKIINFRLGKKSGYSYEYETVTQRNNVSRHYLKSKGLYLDDKREGASYYYYPSGKIWQVINYKNGRRQDSGREYDENGTVITILEYRNDFLISRDLVNRVNAQGEKIGTWISFYPNGERKEEELYKNGELEVATLFSEKGNPLNQRTYRDGVLIEEGLQMIAEPMELTSYWDDGVTIKQQGTYLDSIPNGYHYFFNQSGVPEKLIRYNRGIRIGEGPIDENKRLSGEYRTFYNTGELRAIIKYTNNAPNGDVTFFYKDGKIFQTGFYNNNVREGVWKWYFPTGNLFREEVYEGGRSNGLCIQYSDSATIVAKGVYVDGEREGAWIEQIGDSREEGSYIMGDKNGLWKTYYNDGKLHHSGNFVQGYPDGRHIFYYPDGKTLKEEQYYVMGRRDKNWKKYNENGSLFLTVTYKNDAEVRINGVRIDK